MMSGSKRDGGSTSSTSGPSSSSLVGGKKSAVTSSSTGEGEYQRLLRALRGLKDIVSASDENRGLFGQNYKDTFHELYIKVFVHAREREELSAVQDELEPIWRTAFPGIDLPKVPERKKKLRILPGTSFEDAVGLLEVHKNDNGNLMMVLKYLEQRLRENDAVKPKNIKSSKVLDVIKKLVETMNPPVPVKQQCDAVVEECNRVLKDAAVELSVKKDQEEKLKLTLSKVENPNAAQKRALDKLSEKKTIVTKGKSQSAATVTASKGKATAANDSKKSAPKLAQSAAKASSALGHKNGADKPKLSEGTKGAVAKPSVAKGGIAMPSAVKGGSSAKPAKRPMTDAEYERMFLKRARETNVLREYEEELSRKFGAFEDANAEL